MAPVWEANNVWLIFALVVLWTGFPRAFGAITSTLFVPLALAAAGIVLRGVRVRLPRGDPRARPAAGSPAACSRCRRW